MKTIIICSQQEPKSNCNPHSPGSCPLDQHSMIKYIIYEAEVTAILNNNTTDKKIYIGSYEREFKNHGANRITSFQHKNKSKATKLACYIWCLKDNKTSHY